MTSSYKQSVNKLVKLSLWGLILSTIGFYLPLPNSIIKGLVVVSLSIFIFLSAAINIKGKSSQLKGKWIFSALFSVIIFSIFPAYFYWDQSFSASIISTSPFLLYGLFIFLSHAGIKKIDIHNLILTIAFISLIAFYIKNILPSFPIGKVGVDPDRGERVFVPGIIFIWYLYFYYLKKCIIIQNKPIYFNYAIVLLCLGIFFLQKGRSQLAVIAVLSLVYYIKNSKASWYKYLLLIIVVLVGGALQASSIRELANVTSTQMDSQNPDQHVREIGMYYYLFEFPTKGINYIIGNGIPSYGKSKYGNDAEAFAEDTKIHLVDIGLVGLYHYWGLLGVGLYIFIFYYFIFRIKTKDYDHSKYFLATLFGQSIVSAVPLYLPPIAAIGLGCYLISNVEIHEKGIISQKKN